MKNMWVLHPSQTQSALEAWFQAFFLLLDLYEVGESRFF